MTKVKDIEVLEVRPADVRPCPFQPRKHFDPVKLAELADSIRESGVQQPPLARRVDGKLELVFGERRWRASSMVSVGYTSISAGDVGPDADFTLPLIVRELDDKEVLRLQLVENLQRENMTPMEEARAYRRLFDEFGESIRSAARLLGVPKSRIHRRAELMRLPDEWATKLEAGEIPLYVVDLALSVPDGAPSRRNGVSALEDALETAQQSRSEADARFVLERRYKRPLKETEIWNSEGMDSERARIFQEFCERELEETPVDGYEVLSYRLCREIFPFDAVDLLSMNCGEYVLADAEPSGMDGFAPGKEPNGCWGDLALRYGAPLFVGCDGKMEVRVLTRRDLVREAAILASSSPEDCLFLVDDAAGQKQQQQAAKRDSDAAERDDESRADVVREMIKALDAAVRKRDRSKAPPPFFFEAALFALQLGAYGFERTDHPAVHCLFCLGLDASKEPLFSSWPGVFEGQYVATDPSAGVESLVICAFVLYQLNDWDGPVEECPEWVELCDIYGIELGGEA